MLKIRDDVDLKELEKFGFYQFPDGIYMNQEGLTIYKDDMNVLVFAHAKRSSHKGWFDFPCIIFDLIQSGIVEKVEE